jgi:holo-[acyl-carrier protein] synthase
VIVGIGVDLCDVARMRRALEGPAGSRFGARVFTPSERAYCESRRATRFESYAARFAAKEAAMKALGTGWARGVRWCDIEVVGARGTSPRLVLHGRAAALARDRGCSRWHVSLSHTAATAVAWVIAESDGTPPPPQRKRSAGAGAPSRRGRQTSSATAHTPATRPSTVQTLRG